jgi:hypothetical protein
MPWLEEWTLILFVRDTEIRRYEPGVREGWVHVESRSSCCRPRGSSRTLPLERGRHSVVHRHRLVWQHDATHYTLHSIKTSVVCAVIQRSHFAC